MFNNLFIRIRRYTPNQTRMFIPGEPGYYIILAVHYHKETDRFYCTAKSGNHIIKVMLISSNQIFYNV